MAGKLSLLDIVRKLDRYDDEDACIFVCEPWTTASKAVVAESPENLQILPVEATQIGATYFIEIFIAREFLDGWVTSLSSPPTLQARCQRLIDYATNDA